jgi:DNA-binding transcriptional LysR family regulator
MDLLAFNILVQIIEHGNLSQAAKFLNMSRANVSYHLARLEKSLGASLLRRTPQGVEATEVGRRIYRHARNILNETELVRDLAHSSTDEISSGGESGRARLQISRNGQPLEELDIAPTLMSRNYPFLCDCIASGLGLGLVPDYMVRRQVEEGHMALGMQDHEFRINQGRMFMLYMPNRFQSAATRALIDFLSDRMGLARMIRPGDAESARQP